MRGGQGGKEGYSVGGIGDQILKFRVCISNLVRQINNLWNKYMILVSVWP